MNPLLFTVVGLFSIKSSRCEKYLSISLLTILSLITSYLRIMNVFAPKINLHGRKVLCVDDLIAPKKQDCDQFLFHTRLDKEDVFFAGAYRDALELIESRSDIGIAIVDIRIPKNLKDLQDFNPENPDKEWGIELIERIYREKDIIMIVISAYTKYDLSDNKPDRLVRSFYSKPVDYDALIKDIEFIVNQNWSKTFDYSAFDNETSLFLQEQATKIKKLTKRIAQDIIDVGRYLIQAKEKLEHGQFYSWLDVEFTMSYTSAARFMKVAKKFKSDSLTDLDILPSALYQLATDNTPETAVSEAFIRAKRGEVITEKLAKEIKNKHKKSKTTKPKAPSSSISELIEEIKSEYGNEEETTSLENQKQDRNRKSESLPTASSFGTTEQPKQTILKIEPGKKAFTNSWWQFGEKHKLFCGEPNSKQFLDKLPKNISLTMSLPPSRNKSLVHSIKSDSEFYYFGSRKDFSLYHFITMIENCLFVSTDYKNVVVMNYMYDLEVVEKVNSLGCVIWLAEPDLDKCDLLLSAWREEEPGTVKRLKY